jgi:hypothetical protein
MAARVIVMLVEDEDYAWLLLQQFEAFAGPRVSRVTMVNPDHPHSIKEILEEP